MGTPQQTRHRRRPRLLLVFGTRPEAIKLAPVALALRARPEEFETLLCSTGQHVELLGQALGPFGLLPDFELGVMRPGQHLAEMTRRILAGLDDLYARTRPDLVMVQGDTTSAFAGALAAYYRRVAVAHLEAGLRTDDLYEPFPEEGNRRLISGIANVHFAPTWRAATQLRRERVGAGGLFVTGNTVIDALLYVHTRLWSQAVAPIPPRRRDGHTLLVTMHRRESYGAPFEHICRAIRAIVQGHPGVEFVLPLHPSPSVRQPVARLLSGHPRIHVSNALPYEAFVSALDGCHFVLTDSGGVQEEAPALSKPVLVLRNKTERIEAIHAGTARLVGTSTDRIVEAVDELLMDGKSYDQMANAQNPFGDGQAAGRIVQALSFHFGNAAEPPDSFGAQVLPEAAAAR